MAAPVTWWTKERIEELKERWRANESAGAIANDMHAKSRNAVIGMVYRLGLSKRALVAITTAAKPKPRVTKVVRRLIKNGESFAVVNQVDAVLDEPAHNFKNPKTFIELDACDCRWPGEPGPGQLFCAAPAVNGYSYCAWHCRIAYVPSKVRA